MIIVAIPCGQHVLEPWGHSAGRVFSEVVGVSIKFDHVCGLFFFFSSPKAHLAVGSLLNPFGDNLETSADRDKGMDPPIVVFKTFGLLQIHSALGICKMLSEVLDKGLLSLKGGTEDSDVVFRLVLCESDIVDEAVDDLSGSGSIGRVSHKGHEGGMWQNLCFSLLPGGKSGLIVEVAHMFVKFALLDL